MNSKNFIDIIWNESDEFDAFRNKIFEPYKHELDLLNEEHRAVHDALKEKYRVETLAIGEPYRKKYPKVRCCKKKSKDCSICQSVRFNSWEEEAEYNNQVVEVFSRFLAEEKELKKKFEDKEYDLTNKIYKLHEREFEAHRGKHPTIGGGTA